ncbi:hypothetical protein CARUB_v10019112mg [Capsella rubella]|uniref:Knottin scorpion toxin-like domain-containing protein n=1 Tax=Capsella rubella TaxID=81985 RepID=R0HKK2_9BRAS|nr:defensin-like protein 107 [Capsella rubella]EOA25750.1 hypothetical protein CARUB_v10019112mg [Capsella rubella]
MAITTKSLISFVFTVILIVSYVNCRMTTSARSPAGYGIKQQDRQCFDDTEDYLCNTGDAKCRRYCIDLGYAYGHCFFKPVACCCQIF